MNALLRLGETVFPHLLDAGWKATALIPLVFVLTRILSKKRPVARYWLWVYCLAGLLVLPIASFFVGEHGMPLLPASLSEEASEHPAPSSEKIVLIGETDAKDAGEYKAELLEVVPEEETGSAAPETAASLPEVEGDIEEPSENIPPLESPKSESTQPTNPEHVTTEALSVTSSQPEAEEESPSAAGPHATHPVAARSHGTRASTFPWRGAIGLMWIAACAAMFVRLLFASIALARLRRSSRPVGDAPLLRLFDEVKQTCGFTTSVQLRTATRVTSPVSVGVLHPMILLPESLPDEMPADQLRPILLHELGHVRWRDHAINVVQRLLEAVFFFHPFVHLLNRHLRSLREEICDVWVMSHCHSATLYAKALTSLAERWLARGGSPIGVGLFNHRVHLPERIKRILSLGKTLPATLSLRTALVLLAVSLLAVGGLSLVSLSAREAKAEGEKVAGREKTTASAQPASKPSTITWKDDVVYRDGKPYAKIVQWEPEADFPMVAFGDQNNNGKTDIWIRFLNGKPLRIEIDGNEDGPIDKWEHYFDGVIDLVEADTDFNRKVDLWQVYDNGKLFREEIDLNADGSVDKWLEADEKGNLVEKEIFSWVAPVRGLGSVEMGAVVTFFNARDRVTDLETDQEKGEVSRVKPESPGGDAASGPKQRALRYWASTGLRMEFGKEVQGRTVISGWYHMGIPEARLPEILESRSQEYRGNYVMVSARYSAEDRGIDGGVDSWQESGPPISGTEEAAAGERKPLYTVTCDDRNRDGKADKWQILLSPDWPSPRREAQFEVTDSNVDGLTDVYYSHSLGYIIDADDDGEFDSFPPESRVPFRAEPVGSAVLLLKVQTVGAEKPPRLLCELWRKEESSYDYHCTRTFWASAGETIRVVKLRSGTYDLQVQVIRPEEPLHFKSTRPSDTLGRTAAEFLYPNFASIGKAQTASETLTLDTRPVFRARLISNDIRPVSRTMVSVSQPGRSPEWVKVWSDDWGDFELFNLPPGEYVLVSSNLEQRIQVLGVDTEPPQRLAIAVPEGSGSPRGRVPEGWEAPLAIFGKVLSHEGEPLSNMKVVVMPVAARPTTVGPPSPAALPPPPGSAPQRVVRREAVTGLDGSYHILGLPRAIYHVSIYNNDFKDMEPVEELVVETEKTPVERELRLSGPMMPVRR